MENPRVTEIKVRIDCNGCVQKIKKALHGIKGINDIYIDVPKQKLTIIGWADPEKIVKAIKKTRKLATIYSETQPPEPPLDGYEPPSDPSNPLQTKTVPSKELENPEPEPEPEPASPAQEPPSKDSKTRSPQAQEVQGVHHYPPDHGYGHSHERVSVEYYSSSPSPVYKHEPSQYNPTPYVTDYKYTRPEPPQQFTHYNRPEPPPQQTLFTRPELPQHYTPYNRPEPPSQQTHFTKQELPQHYTHYNPPPQQTHFTKQELPQHYTHYNIPEPPPQQTHFIKQELPQHYTQYNRPEPPPQQTHYTRPEPPQHYTHYSKPEPPLQYTHYNKPEPPRPYTNYGRAEVLSPHYTNYNSEYHSSSNGNGNITSIFSDENPNSCAVV
ncbi:hypothetical protein L1987_77256 [Smallanthus sonchifolius]|uniref:Uncharacterized protein n=1 Tax=Smallanthus sonchifolius TaxID=185202 RepID=A0ACB8Z929_9ASTR|nr:hypothetical protein L1987_77256 [Smallanthus sonchifolius]